MDEANELCSRLSIMNSGRIAVTGSPDELKSTVGADIVTIKIGGVTGGKIPSIPPEIGRLIQSENGLLEIQTAHGESEIAPIVNYLEGSGFTINSVSLARPSLGDVFLKYGGRSLESGTTTMQEVRSMRRSFVR